MVWITVAKRWAKNTIHLLGSLNHKVENLWINGWCYYELHNMFCYEMEEEMGMGHLPSFLALLPSSLGLVLSFLGLLMGLVFLLRSLLTAGNVTLVDIVGGWAWELKRPLPLVLRASLFPLKREHAKLLCGDWRDGRWGDDGLWSKRNDQKADMNMY